MLNLDTEVSMTTKDFSEGEKVAKISVACMVFLTILKGGVGIAYGSVALIADAINSFSDILASALIWSGLRLAGRGANERFPYGYFRAETLASLVVSIMIVITGLQIISEAIMKLFDPLPLTVSIIPLIAALTSSIIYFGLAKYKKRVGLAIGSHGLVADSTHSMLDVYSGIIVFIGILFSMGGIPIAEILVAAFIGLYILKEGGFLAKDAVLSLMDAIPDEKYREQIERVAEQYPDIEDIHEIKIRRAGPILFAEMHMHVVGEMSVERAHHLTEHIEEDLCKAIEDLEIVSVHVEPSHPKVNADSANISDSGAEKK